MTEPQVSPHADSTPPQAPRAPWQLLTLGGVLTSAGVALLVFAVYRQNAWAALAQQLGTYAFGWSGFTGLLNSVGSVVMSLRHGAIYVDAMRWLALGSAALVLGLGTLMLALGGAPPAAEPPSQAVGARLYPPLAKYRDFYWGTLLAYGGGILASELLLMLAQTMLANSSRRGRFALPPVPALGISLLVGSAVAFLAGYAGAARARRLSAPEATIGVVYGGLLIPAFLTVLPGFPMLELKLGPVLREVTYAANLLGRPELAYWLVFCLLVLMMVFGITTGFVATSSGRMDLRTGFELFVAERHVAVFRPRLLVGVFAVLIFLIIPPIIVFALLRAADAAVDRNRIRKLGLTDPMLASKALHQQRLKEPSATGTMTALSVGGVGVGVMALIIVLSVMSGFEQDLQTKILGTNAHAVLLKYADSMEDYREVMKQVSQVPGIIGETPFIMNEVMVSSDQNVAGTIIKGIDPSTVGDVTDVRKNILPGGSLDGLQHPESIKARPEEGDLYSPDKVDPFGAPPKKLSPEIEPALPAKKPAPVKSEGKSKAGKAAKKTGEEEDDEDGVLSVSKTAAPTVLPGIVIGRELAGRLRVGVGDRINVVSPLGGELGPNGPTPKIKAFRISGIFFSGMYEYDSKFVYIWLPEAEKFFGLKGATGIELKVNDIDDARRIAHAVQEKVNGYPFHAQDWGEMNRNLFSALRLEKLVMGIILTIIVIVAAGLIVATVIMLVLEKRKEIAVLKALGVPDGGIVKIFLAEGLQIGIAGGVLGLVSGLSWCLILERWGLQLDPEIYYIPSLPVKIEPLQTILAVVIAVLVTYLASIYPALKASRVEPVEGLKAE